MAAARVARKRQLGYVLKRRIAALDPEKDHEEVARLTLEVFYGEPNNGVHATYLIGFSRQVAVPSIARVIYRVVAATTYTDDGRRVVDGFFEDWATRWFPRRARLPLGRQVLLALMDDDLCAALRPEAPSKYVERLVPDERPSLLPAHARRPNSKRSLVAGLFRSPQAKKRGGLSAAPFLALS